MTTTQQGNTLAYSGDEALTAKRRGLSQRPTGLTVGDLIDRYMRAYAGRDTSRTQRLAAWTALIGAMTLEELDADLIHAARAELQRQPALAYKGTDFQDRPIFKAKQGNAPKSAATLNRYIVAFSAVCTWAIEQRLAPSSAPRVAAPPTTKASHEVTQPPRFRWPKRLYLETYNDERRNSGESRLASCGCQSTSSARKYAPNRFRSSATLADTNCSPSARPPG